MKIKMRWMKILLVAGGLLLAAAPTPALAHDNLGGDELAVANWMLVAALVTVVIGLFWALWAWRAGQFSNVEESKYRMLELADDFDAIMAEDAERERLWRAAQAKAAEGAGVGVGATPTVAKGARTERVAPASRG